MIALIPARGGSKGLPRKNVRLLNGKPLIAYTIEAARKSSGIDDVVVTTDDEEIAKIAVKYGARVPFLRPRELSTDTALAVDVYLHAIDFLQIGRKEEIKKFMVLLPTAPLRTEKHIEEALNLFYQLKPDTLVSMREAETPVSWYFERSADLTIHNAGFGNQDVIANRQVNKVYYIPNGAIYILDTALLREKRTYYSNNTIPYIMFSEDSVDIDTLIDFQMAELLLKKREMALLR